VGAGARGVGLASKVGKIPVVGGVIQKHGMSIGLRAVEGLWAGSVGMRVHAAPTWEEKGRVSGKIMASEVLPLAVAIGAPGLIAPVTPIRIKAEGYSGYGIKGSKKAVTTTQEVPALQRGGVYEADLLRKPPTTTKDVITGYVREPIPIVGIKRAKFTTEGATEGIAEVTTTWKGLQFGRRPTSKGASLVAREETAARVGQFRYVKEGDAVGRITEGYFLPKVKPKSTPPEDPLLMLTAPPPKPTRIYAEYTHPYAKTGDMPLYGSPARVQWFEVGTHKLSYGIKGGAKQPKIELGGWKQPRGTKSPGDAGIPPIEMAPSFVPTTYPHAPPDVRFRTTKAPASSRFFDLAHFMRSTRAPVRTPPSTPAYPTGLAAGEVATPRYFPGYTPPKQIPPDMYFVTEGVPASSRFFDFGHMMRPATPKPIKPLSTKPADSGIGVVTPRVKSEGIPPIPKPKPEAEGVPYVAPTTCIGGVCPRDASLSTDEPQLQRAPKPVTSTRKKPKHKEKKASTLEEMLGVANPEPIITHSLTTKPATSTRKKPKTKIQGKSEEALFGVESATETGLAPVSTREKQRRPASAPTRYSDPLAYYYSLLYPETSTSTATATATSTSTSTKPKEKRRPVRAPTTYPDPLIYPDPIPTPAPTTLTQPKEMRRPVPFIHIATDVIDPRRPIYIPPPPPPIIVPPRKIRIPPPPPPPPPFTPLIGGGDGGMGGGGGLRGKGRRAWDIENPLITLDEFFASPPQPKKPVKPVGMIPMIPAGVV
jgi:hypothetical protein